MLRILPRALTGADPETLSFLSTDRYDTASARAFAERAGLRMPPVEAALRAWADDLVAARFGAAETPHGPYGYQQVAGTATWISGERERPAHVLLHGLPRDSGSWQEVADRLDGPVLAAGLARPGQARRVVAALRAAHAARDELRQLLARVSVPVEIVTGSADPLTAAVGRPVTTIKRAGHYPQLTHPAEVAAAIR
ncbi:alpha/beta fold hydrolase [Nonomuraea sp. GTA35]|uniref:alpha/beta fold hydrolase n=1 Tax=Nonomuraea sp. GTA35 TaxID=1676746 RepID=UPI0035BEC32D